MADEKTPLNIFVTGGSTSAGLATVKALVRNGHKVVATTTNADGARAIRNAGALPAYPDLTREGEILSAMRMANADIVVHAAPQKFGQIPQANFDYVGKAQWLVDSTNAVVSAAGRNEVNKIISISFGYLYDVHHGESATEDGHVVHGKEYEPMLHAEAAVLDGGIDGYVIRAGYIYGGNSMGTTSISEVIRNGHSVPSGKHHAAWVHEDDLAQLIVKLVEAESDKDTLAEIINAADDHPQTPDAFAQLLGNETGITALSYASSGGIMTLIRGETLRDKLLAREISLDSTKARQKYGWKPQYASAEAGMDATSLIWRATEATVYDDHDYVDKAAEAIAALESGIALALPEEVEEEAPAKVEEKPKPAPKPQASKPAEEPDGPTPWSESEDAMEERRRKALERKKARAEKRAQGG